MNIHLTFSTDIVKNNITVKFKNNAMILFLSYHNLLQLSFFLHFLAVILEF